MRGRRIGVPLLRDIGSDQGQRIVLKITEAVRPSPFVLVILSLNWIILIGAPYPLTLSIDYCPLGKGARPVHEVASIALRRKPQNFGIFCRKATLRHGQPRPD